MSTTKSKVPMGQKIAFGLGMLANQMFPAALGIFMVVLIQNLGFPTWMYSILFFLPRILDCFTDPIMGFISDNTRSKWGRRRHYVFIGAIIMGISYFFMWQMYKADGIQFNFLYHMSWAFVFYIGLTIFSVPYVAMGYEMSDDFHERTNIMAVAQWIGQWAWVIAPWFWVVMYDPSWFEGGADQAVRTLAMWVGIPCAILAMIPAIFIKSKSTKDDESLTPLTINNIGGSLRGIWDGAVEAFKIDAFRKLCYATFLIFNSFQTVAGFSFFIIVYYLFDGVTGPDGSWIWPTLFGCIGALVTTFLVIPIVTRMSKVMGKKKAFLISQGISLIGYILLWFLFIPGKPFLILFALPFFSFGIGALFTLMMSMTADVCDLDELDSGKRREGIFGAMYWWMVKFGFAIAGGLSALIMLAVGFDPSLPSQPEGAITGLRLFFTGLPMLGTIVAMYIMRDYDLTEKKALEIGAELKKRKSTKPKPSKTDKLLSIATVDINNALESNTDFSNKSEEDIKAQFSKTLKEGMHGLCFSPYLEGQNIGDKLSEEQIIRRMQIVKPYTKWVRSFSCINDNDLIPKIAHVNGLKTMVGAWIDGDKETNEQEIEALIALGKKGHVNIAVVGNEVLMREELSEQEIINYIKRVKKALPDVLVGYVDAYYQFHERPNLVNACDVILANCYPFWEGCSLEQSVTYLNEMYTVTKTAAKGKPVIVSETGWPSEGEATKGAVPSSINAMKYFIDASNWAKKEQVNMYYFSSFDESWKIHQEGDVGAKWGIWDKNENIKYK